MDFMLYYPLNINMIKMKVSKIRLIERFIKDNK